MNYIVLEKDTVEDVMALTGLNETEVRHKLEESILFGHKDVFWGVLDQWYSVRVSGEYVYLGELDFVVQEAMRRSV